MQTLTLTPITYRRKVIDVGYVIGTRKYAWLAKKRYFPIWALSAGSFISEILYKRLNPVYYIPKSCLKTGITFKMFDKLKMQEPIKYKVLAVNGTSFNVKQI